ISDGVSVIRAVVRWRASVFSRFTTRGSAATEGCNCPVPTSTAKTCAAPRPRQTSVKPPVEAPTSSTTRPSIATGHRSSACASFKAPRPTQGWAASASITASSATFSEGLSITRPSAFTNPVSMAARARARLSKTPRATRSWSILTPLQGFQPLQRGLQPGLALFGFSQFDALLLDHFGGGAGDEVGVAQLLVHMADVSVEDGDLLLKARAFGVQIDDPGQRQGDRRTARDEGHGSGGRGLGHGDLGHAAQGQDQVAVTCDAFSRGRVRGDKGERRLGR